MKVCIFHVLISNLKLEMDVSLSDQIFILNNSKIFNRFSQRNLKVRKLALIAASFSKSLQRRLQKRSIISITPQLFIEKLITI